MERNQYDGSQTGSPVPREQMQQTPPQEKPGRKRRGKRWISLFLGILLSFGAGLGGGYTALQLWGASSAEQEGTSEMQLNYASNGSVTQATPASADSVSAGQILELASESVVEVVTELKSNDVYFRQYVQEGAGSGVILSEDGYIVTNNHVIEGATKVTVRLKNGESYVAQVKGYDKETDIALLKIEAQNLLPAAIGESGNLAVGDRAFVIGNPLGTLGGTVTQGIISALNREIDVDGISMTLLQTDAAVNPGNSGGALFNDRGQLVGIIVAKSSGSNVEGLGFAIPIDKVTPVLEQLGQYGYVKGRISLGMSLIDIENQQLAMMYRVNRTGVYVQKVESESSAQKAGIRSGDCILSIDGQTIEASGDISTLMEQYQVGDTISIALNRDGQDITLSLTLEESVPAAV